ncbi:hypothetical protein HNV11_08910 [Spirosoma taeanense]|uniref:Uncharacterized protein n=1 Tax=Spirosoma taeanense TaxID=2735870 RepID=A0A6M5Y6E3_9BACT|nr:hypothetical protein [Spirosoma taeanense]QJW89489.1 hypothetical protein HNV11_08910 [Spirosoma taeanense]
MNGLVGRKRFRKGGQTGFLFTGTLVGRGSLQDNPYKSPTTPERITGPSGSGKEFR